MGTRKLQTTACKARNLDIVFQNMPICFNCNLKASADCRFKGCRAVTSFQEIAQVEFVFPENQESARHRQVYNRIPSASVIVENLTAIAQILYPLLLEERTRISSSSVAVMRRQRELKPRVTCDICNTAIFWLSWFCISCGVEICEQCMSSLDELQFTSDAAQCSNGTDLLRHLQADLHPLSRFQDAELAGTIAAMDLIMKKHSSTVTTPSPQDPYPPTMREVPRIECSSLTVQGFRTYWSRGVPVIATGVDAQIQGSYGPAYFIAEYGKKKVTVHDCESEKTRLVTVAELFAMFGASDSSKKIWKLKDWPPRSDFSKDFRELYDAFIKGVPLPDFASLIGVRNLAAYFARNTICPDLGPKMYNAYGSKQDDQHHGSTKLHMDITDAVNVMLWTKGSAVWHIFSTDDTSKLRDFLREDVGFQGPGDPIHSQDTYMTPAMLDRLSEKYSIGPYTIIQGFGEAVFIPAGCPHQVSNAADAIKIACDFVSVDNLKHTQRLTAEFRQQRLDTSVGEDVLQFYATLWYAWTCLSELYKSAPGDDVTILDPNGDALSHPMKQRQRRKSKNRRYKIAQNLSAQMYKPGHDFSCPLCPRASTRPGLLNHLKSMHSDKIRLLDQDICRLRQPKTYTDEQFRQQIQSMIPNTQMEGSVVNSGPVC